MIRTAGLVLRRGIRRLEPALGKDAPRDARALMAHVLDVEPGQLTGVLNRIAVPAQISRFEHLVKRRLAHEPVSQIIGHRLFWGRRFRITRDVLDPRPETEVLIDRALRTPAAHILDLGTGSGAILLTLLAEWHMAAGTGVDTSDAALDVAAENARMLGVAPRATLRQGNWFRTVEGIFDLIVSNPPYVTAAEYEELQPEIREWEPTQAITPGGDGLGGYRAILREVWDHLLPGGRLIVEIGPSQATAVCALFVAAGFMQPQVFADLDRRDRVIEAKKPV